MLERRLPPRYWTKFGGFQSRALRLIFSVEVVDEREDEAADRANEHQPIKKFHARHLLPSGKKPTISDLPHEVYHAFR